MALEVPALGTAMIAEAARVAKGGWQKIKEAATIELRGLAQRIALIVDSFRSGNITQSIAKRHLRTARFHVAATIAMLTSMLEAAAEKVVNAAIAVVRDAVNSAIGFALV